MPARTAPLPRPVPAGAAIAVALLTALALAACGGARPGSEAGSTGAEGNGRLCSVLTPADFAAAGIPGAGEPEVNADEFGAYCVYAGESGASGGIELDVFPHADTTAAHETYATALAEGPTGEVPPGPAFDEASFAVAGDVLFLTARQGTTVVALAVPSDGATIEGLVTLARLAADRAGALGQ